MKTGVIGLGAMGAGMALNLHRHGHLHRLYNRTAFRAEGLAAETGVARAMSMEELAADCELILISVSADQDVIDVVERIAPSVTADTIVVDTSTVSSETARKTAAILARSKADFLDAPVSGGVEGAAAGSLAMMVGGSAAVFARAHETLTAIAARIEHIGPTGSGQACKAVNQIMVAGINQAVTDALAFGACLGLNMDKVIEVIARGAAANWFLDHRGKTMLAGDYEKGFKVKLHHKDLLICTEMARNVNLPLPIIEATLRQYRRLMAEGQGEKDISALYRLKKTQE
ncbi:MAG: NAD(P)-dependent oxidoreductase [Gammaproteobacteria bacterium]|nr:MAG: NAD(P)-dependent oxidoreductase [Gammaproteobacteria bacterium]